MPVDGKDVRLLPKPLRYVQAYRVTLGESQKGSARIAVSLAVQHQVGTGAFSFRKRLSAIVDSPVTDNVQVIRHDITVHPRVIIMKNEDRFTEFALGEGRVAYVYYGTRLDLFTG